MEYVGFTHSFNHLCLFRRAAFMIFHHVDCTRTPTIWRSCFVVIQRRGQDSQEDPIRSQTRAERNSRGEGGSGLSRSTLYFARALPLDPQTKTRGKEGLCRREREREREREGGTAGRGEEKRKTEGESTKI